MSEPLWTVCCYFRTVYRVQVRFTLFYFWWQEKLKYTVHVSTRRDPVTLSTSYYLTVTTRNILWH